MRAQCSLLACLVLAILAVCPGAASPAQATPNTAANTELRKELELGLRARLPSEFAFIAQVVAKVDMGQLPEELVKGTFQFARQKNARVPFPYFERIMRLRAEKIGVTL